MSKHVFAGRRDELGLLKTCFSEMSDQGRARVAFIEGKPGDGKTSLVEEFIRQLSPSKDPDFYYAVSTCDFLAAHEVLYEPFRELLAQLLGVSTSRVEGAIGIENSKNIFLKIEFAANAIASLAPALIDLMSPEALLAVAANSFLLSVLRRKKEFASETRAKFVHVSEQCKDYFGELSSKGRKLLIVIDDIQWIDESSLKLLSKLTAELSSKRVMFILLYRRGELGRNTSRAFARLRNEVSCIDVRLGHADNQASFIEDFLKANGYVHSKECIDFLIENGVDGNAILLSELVLFLSANGGISADAFNREASVKALSLNSSLHAKDSITRLNAFIEARLTAISEEGMQALQIASVQGFEFLAQVITDLTQFSEKQTFRLLDSILDRNFGIVQELREEWIDGKIVSYYRFSNVLYQQYFYSKISSAEKRILHGEVATSLESHFGRDANRIAADLHLHYRQAKHFEKSVDYLLIAARARSSETNEALKTLEEARKLAESRDYLRGMMQVSRIDSELRIEEHAGTLTAELEKCVVLAKKLEDLETLTVAYRLLGRDVRRASGSSTTAMYYYMLSLSLSEKTGNLREQGRIFTNIGVLAKMEKDYERALSFFKMREKNAEIEVNGVRDTFGLATTYLNMAWCHRELLQPDESERLVGLAKQLLRHEERHSFSLQCGCLIQMAQNQIMAREYQKAACAIIEAVEISSKRQIPSRRRTALLIAAKLFWEHTEKTKPLSIRLTASLCADEKWRNTEEKHDYEGLISQIQASQLAPNFDHERGETKSELTEDLIGLTLSELRQLVGEFTPVFE